MQQRLKEMLGLPFGFALLGTQTIAQSVAKVMACGREHCPQRE